MGCENDSNASGRERERRRAQQIRVREPTSGSNVDASARGFVSTVPDLVIPLQDAEMNRSVLLEDTGPSSILKFGGDDQIANLLRR